MRAASMRQALNQLEVARGGSPRENRDGSSNTLLGGPGDGLPRRAICSRMWADWETGCRRIERVTLLPYLNDGASGAGPVPAGKPAHVGGR